MLLVFNFKDGTWDHFNTASIYAYEQNGKKVLHLDDDFGSSRWMGVSHREYLFDDIESIMSDDDIDNALDEHLAKKLKEYFGDKFQYDYDSDD